jgi:hypothetical protein
MEGPLGRNRRVRRPFLLEALTAKYRAPLRGLEGNSCLPLAGRTHGLGFNSLEVAPILRKAEHLGALGLAAFAAFGLVLELFVVEEKLFASSENKISATVDTLEELVLEIH